MGTNCARRVADLFLICYESYFMKSHTKEKRNGMIDAFNSTSILREINLAFSDKAGCLSDLLTEWEII